MKWFHAVSVVITATGTFMGSLAHADVVRSGLSQGANGDLVIFGVPLGQPLALPACPPFIPASGKAAAATAPSTPAATCQKPPRELRPGSVEVTVQFAPEEKPSFLYSSMVGRNPEDAEARAFTVTLIAGKAEIIRAGTDGTYVQDQVRSKLEAKYGKPVLDKRQKFTNAYGGGFESIEEAWERPNLKVSFTGATSSGDHGQILFVSDAGFDYMQKIVQQAHGSERQL